MSRADVEKLPKELLAQASLHGNEYAWPLSVIPEVIRTAESLQLMNVGGQLQFRMPDATCECYWVEVDTGYACLKGLPWSELVAKSAIAALEQFQALHSEFDFMAEGRKAFEKHIDQFADAGGDPENAMCFVWYLESRN